MKYVLTIALVILSAAPAFAARSNSTAGGKQVVTHSRKAPVAVHRALPPYGVGKHVYNGR